MNFNRELEKYREACAKKGYTTIVNYQDMSIMVVKTDHRTVVRPITLACATYFVL
jgi:hypothetical protein